METWRDFISEFLLPGAKRRLERLVFLGRGSGLLSIGLLGGKTEFRNKIEVFLYGWVGGGEEFVSIENRVGPSKETHRLSFFGKGGASGREADFALGNGDARDRDHADEFEDIHSLVLGHGGAGHGHELVDGDGFGGRVKGGNDLDHFEAIFGGFAEAEDSAATD